MERIATDMLGPLPETSNGNRYILVIGDYFTKWTETFAIPDKTIETVAKSQVNEAISRNGVPAFIHSDQGKQFEGHVYQEVCTLLNTKKTRTTPYHPHSDIMVNRLNRMLERFLSAFVNMSYMMAYR